ncbi:MAG: CPBP family intramembrane glutamic endopeptidase, partial [Myxococcota bacterium]
VRKPVMPWWGALAIAAVLAVSLQAVLAVAAGVQAVSHGIAFGEGYRLAAFDPLNLALAQAAGCACAVWVGLRWREEGTLRTRLGIAPCPQSVVALALVAGLAVQFPLAEVQNLTREVWPLPVEQQLRMRHLLTPDGPWNALAIVFALVVVAPVGEELVFRGVMLPGLERRYGIPVALVASALLFGVAHPELGMGLTAAIAGLLLGAVALRTGSVLPTIAMHAGINSVPVLLPERLLPVPGLNTVSEEVYHIEPPLLLAATVVAAGALLGLMWLTDDEPR